jgi:hypothetical protein
MSKLAYKATKNALFMEFNQFLLNILFSNNLTYHKIKNKRSQFLKKILKKINISMIKPWLDLEYKKTLIKQFSISWLKE